MLGKEGEPEKSSDARWVQSLRVLKSVVHRGETGREGVVVTASFQEAASMVGLSEKDFKAHQDRCLELGVVIKNSLVHLKIDLDDEERLNVYQQAYSFFLKLATGRVGETIKSSPENHWGDLGEFEQIKKEIETTGKIPARPELRIFLLRLWGYWWSLRDKENLEKPHFEVF